MFFLTPPTLVRLPAGLAKEKTPEEKKKTQPQGRLDRSMSLLPRNKRANCFENNIKEQST
jgi:hypothetical protein